MPGLRNRAQTTLQKAASPLLPPTALVFSFNIAGVNNFPCSKAGIHSWAPRKGRICVLGKLQQSCHRKIALQNLSCSLPACSCLSDKNSGHQCPCSCAEEENKAKFVLSSSAGLASALNVQIGTTREPQCPHTCGFIHSHSWTEVKMFQLGLFYRAQCFQSKKIWKSQKNRKDHKKCKNHRKKKSQKTL